MTAVATAALLASRRARAWAERRPGVPVLRRREWVGKRHREAAGTAGTLRGLAVAPAWPSGNRAPTPPSVAATAARTISAWGRLACACWWGRSASLLPNAAPVGASRRVRKTCAYRTAAARQGTSVRSLSTVVGCPAWMERVPTSRCARWPEATVRSMPTAAAMTARTTSVRSQRRPAPQQAKPAAEVRPAAPGFAPTSMAWIDVRSCPSVAQAASCAPRTVTAAAACVGTTGSVLPSNSVRRSESRVLGTTNAVPEPVPIPATAFPFASSSTDAARLAKSAWRIPTAARLNVHRPRTPA